MIKGTSHFSYYCKFRQIGIVASILRIPEMSTHGDLITRRRRTQHGDLDTIPREVVTTPGELVIQSLMGLTTINKVML